MDGRLPLGILLPGERDLAVVLGASRITVVSAYRTLRDQGFLSARVRARSQVAVPSRPSAEPDSGATGSPVADSDGSGAGAGLIDLARAAPAAPGVELHRAYARALEQLPRHLPRHANAEAGPPELRVAAARRLAQARAGTDLGSPVVEQLACAELLDGVDAQRPAGLAELRERRAVLLDLLARHLPDWRVGVPAGGLSVWARLPRPVSSALAAIAPRLGVLLSAGPRFGTGGSFERFLRLPYVLDPPRLRAGVAGVVRAAAAVHSGHRVPDGAPAPPA